MGGGGSRGWASRTLRRRSCGGESRWWIAAGPVPAQPYHAAVGLDIRRRGTIGRQTARRARRLWRATGLRAMIEDLRMLGHQVAGCGLLLGSGGLLPALESILASHPLIHTAEGELFREALRAAIRQCGLPLVAVKERELFTRAAADLRIPAKPD